MLKKSSLICSSLFVALFSGWSSAAVVYQRINLITTNFVPFGDDGTPSRPSPGDHLGQQVTLAGSERYLTRATVSFGIGSSTGTAVAAHDTYTCALYQNDGAGGAPGTQIVSSSVVSDNPGGSAIISVTFPLSAVVPDTFTVVVSSTHPTNTWNTTTGLVGPQSVQASPAIGSAANTLWYNTNAAATTWVSNSTWAVNDGAPTNYFGLTLEASPSACATDSTPPTITTCGSPQSATANGSCQAAVPDFATAGITAIAGGGYHGLVVKTGGTVRAWGYNSEGELGDGTTTSRTTQVQVLGLSGVIAIAGGVYHSLVLQTDGTVRAWGFNGFGQLGDGTITDRHAPVQVSGLSGVTAMTGGLEHSLALKSDGTVWAWGYNGDGELGDGTGSQRNAPVQVHGPGNVGFLSGIIAISGGWNHSLALKSDGTVWAWGLNFYGELGDGTNTNRTTPVQVLGLSGVTAMAGGFEHSLALKSDGTVWAWGFNGDGELGDGTTINRTTPVQVSGLSGVTAMAGGRNHSLAVKTDGTLWAWGYNGAGQVGDGTITDRHTSVQVHGPGNVGFLSGITAISAGAAYSLTLQADGTVRAWGANGNGQLGDGTTTQRNTPVQTSGFSGIGVTATDNCTPPGSLVRTQSPAAGTLVGVGVTTVTVTVKDAFNNAATCTNTFTVTESVRPTITSCGSNASASADASCQAAVPTMTADVTATDNCTASGSLTKTQSPSAGTLVGLGVTTVTITVTDVAGNSATCTKTFTVTGSSSCCTNAADCDDSNVCTTDTCFNNACQHTLVPPCCNGASECDDSDACTTDTCVNNACQYTLVSPCCNNDPQCDDSDTCTTDTCVNNVCQHAPGPDADADGVPDCHDTCPGTIPGATVDSNGCPPLIRGDFDRDGDVDGADFDHFKACALGSGIPQIDPNCANAKLDTDDDVDMDDFSVFQRCYSGAGKPVNNPTCAQ